MRIIVPLWSAQPRAQHHHDILLSMLWDTCPNCNALVIFPSNYAAICRAAEAGKYEPKCDTCGHVWAYTLEHQQTIAAELRKRMDETPPPAGSS